jgi:quercetin dioxygenase-like cupin family protein
LTAGDIVALEKGAIHSLKALEEATILVTYVSG